MASPSEVKTYLKQRRRSSLSEMAVPFGVAEDTMRALLEPWVAKSKVHRIESPADCGGSCSKSCCCGTLPAAIYEWCDRQ